MREIVPPSRILDYGLYLYVCSAEHRCNARVRFCFPGFMLHVVAAFCDSGYSGGARVARHLIRDVMSLQAKLLILFPTTPINTVVVISSRACRILQDSSRALIRPRCRVRMGPKYCGSSQVGPGGYQYGTGRVGSGNFRISRVGSDHPDPI